MSSGPGRDYNWSPFQIDDADDYATVKAKHAALLDILQLERARLRMCETTGSPSLVPGSGIDFVDCQVFNSEMPEAAPGSLFTGSRSPASPPQTRECGGHSSPRRADPEDLEPERKTRSSRSGEKRENTHLSAGTGNQALAPSRKRGRLLEETSGQEREARWATSLGAVHHGKALETEHAAAVEGRPLEQGPVDAVPSGARATDRNAIMTGALTMGRSAPGFVVIGGVQRTPLGVPAPLPQGPNPDVTEFRTPCVPRIPAPGLSAVRGARTGNFQGVPRSFLPSGIPTDLPSNSVGAITSSAPPQPTANPAGNRRYMQLDLLRPAAPLNPVDSPADPAFLHATDHPGPEAKALSCHPRTDADVHLHRLVQQPSAVGATASSGLMGHGKEQTAPVAVIQDHAPAAEDIPVRTQNPAESSSGFWGSAKLPPVKGYEGVPHRTVARPQPPQGLQRMSGNSLGVKFQRKPAASPPWRSKRKAAAPPKHLRGLRREPPGVGRQRRGVLVPLVNSVVDECSVGEADLALFADQDDVENPNRVPPIPALHQDPDDHCDVQGQPSLGTHCRMLPDSLPHQGDGSALLAPGPDIEIQPESLANRQTLSSESVGMPDAVARSLPSAGRTAEASTGARPLHRQRAKHSHDEASLDLGVEAVPPGTEVNGLHSPLPAHESSGASLQMVPDTLLPMSQAVLYLDSGPQQQATGNRTEPHSSCREKQGAGQGQSSAGTPSTCPAQVVGDDAARVPASPDLGLCATIPDTPPSDPREIPGSAAPGAAGHIGPLPLDFGPGATRLPQEGSPPLPPMDDDTVPESDPGEVLFPALATAQNPTASPALICQPNLSAAEGSVGARKTPPQCKSPSTGDVGPCAPTPLKNPPGISGVGTKPPPWSESPQRSGGSGPAPSQQVGGSLVLPNLARTASRALPELGTLVEVVPLTPAESGPRDDSTGDPDEQPSPLQTGNLQDGLACMTRYQATLQDPSSKAAVALPGVNSADNPSSASPVPPVQPKPDRPTGVVLPSLTTANQGVSKTMPSHYEGTGVDISGVLPANPGGAPVGDEGVPVPNSPGMPSAFTDEETALGPASLATPHQMPAGGPIDRSHGHGEVSDRAQHARNTAPAGEAAAEERPGAREPPALDLVCRAVPHDCDDPRPDGSTAGVRNMQPSEHNQEPSLVPAHGAGTTALGASMEVGAAGQLGHDFLPSHEPEICQETHDLVPPTSTFDRVGDQRYSHQGSHDLMPPGFTTAHGQGTDTVPCRAAQGQTEELMTLPARVPGGDVTLPTRDICGQLPLNGEQNEAVPAAFSYTQGQAGHDGRMGTTGLPQPAVGSSYAGENIRSLFTRPRRAAVPEVGGSLARTTPLVLQDKGDLSGEPMPAQAAPRLAQPGVLHQAEDRFLPGQCGAASRAWQPGASRFEGLEVSRMSHQGECSSGQTHERHTGPATAHQPWGLPNQTHGQAVTSKQAPPPKDDCIPRSDRMQGPPHQDQSTRLSSASFGEARSVAMVEGAPHQDPNRHLAKARFGEAHRLARVGTPEVDLPIGDGRLNQRHIQCHHDPAGLAGPDCAQPAMGLTKPPQKSSAHMDDEVGCLDLRMPNPVTALAFSSTGRFLAVLMSEGGGDARTILVWQLGQPPGEQSATHGPPICVGEITGHLNRSLFPGQYVSESSALQVMDLGEAPVVLSAATLPLTSASKSTPMPNGVTACDMRQHLAVSLPTAHATCCVLLDHDDNLFTSGAGPNVTYWTADAKLLEPNAPSKALPKAAIRGEPFLDVVSLSATRGLLLGCSSAGQVAIWDVMRAQLLMAGSPPMHSSVPAVLTAIPALNGSAAFLMLAIPKVVLESGTVPHGHPVPSGSSASILLHLQQTGGFHQDSFLAGKAIVMAGDPKGCAAIADRYGGVLLWRDGRHVKSLRSYGKRITALAVANGQVACASRNGRVLCYNLDESLAAADQ